MQPAEPFPGVAVSAEFFKAALRGTASPHAVFPEEFAPRLAHWCLHPGELSQNDLTPFVPAFERIDPRDPRMRALAAALTRTVSTHSVTTHLMETESWDLLAVSYDMIESLIVDLARYADSGPGDLFYQKACGAAYGFSDMMLGRILQLAGSGAAVILVSAQGYRFVDDRQPGKPYKTTRGFFCMTCPGVKPDELVSGASLLDLAPTVLLALGAPIGSDLEGQALTRTFDAALQPGRVLA
jgi:hypothetical protein